MVPYVFPLRRIIARLVIVSLALVLVACAAGLPSPTPALPPALPTPTVSLTPSATISPTIASTPTPPGRSVVWENFPAPRLTPVTPIPPPLTGLSVPEEVRVLAIAGVDETLPYAGRTDAIVLVIYHPRLARASLVSVPPDLFGYIPGYTMQRMYTAYAVGGPDLMNSTLEYNLGIKPDSYAVFNLDSFGTLIDDLGGIQVPVLENILNYCPDIPPGDILMSGDQVICYMRLRLGEDERSRNARQQQVLQAVFLRLVENGNLVHVPDLYNAYRSSIDSNLTLDDLLRSFPLALKLGDPNRTGFFQMGSEQLITWQISDQPEARVFLPARPALMRLMQQAVNFVTTPSPLSAVVVTLEYELTVSPTPTNTSEYTPPPILIATATSIPSTPTRTRTPGPTLTRTVTPSPTITQSTVTP